VLLSFAYAGKYLPAHFLTTDTYIVEMGLFVGTPREDKKFRNLLLSYTTYAGTKAATIRNGCAEMLGTTPLIVIRL